MPAPIPDTPENVARALVSTPPKDDGEWNYLKDREIELEGALLEKDAERQVGRGLSRPAGHFRI